jgi:hypothetical protein
MYSTGNNITALHFLQGLPTLSSASYNKQILFDRTIPIGVYNNAKC